MRRTSHRSTWVLLLVLLLLFGLPHRLVSGARSTCVAALSPGWHLLHAAPSFRVDDAEVGRLRAENQILRAELERACDLGRLRHPTLEGVVAHVIYREPNAWNSFLWINVGRLDSDGQVAKGSPVVVAESLIGMVDYVGRHQSRVRLITDSSLHPSVRVVRGAAADCRLYNLASELEEVAEGALCEELAAFKAGLDPEGSSLYLAKGELVGSSEREWRGGGDLVRGVGFHYDFADGEGPARDLRGSLPLVALGDLLVTTGMDGCFPRGLQVARVVSIAPLREGAFCYELDARPTCGSLDQLTSVLVLPPLGFNQREVASARQFPQPNRHDRSDS